MSRYAARRHVRQVLSTSSAESASAPSRRNLANPPGGGSLDAPGSARAKTRGHAATFPPTTSAPVDAGGPAPGPSAHGGAEPAPTAVSINAGATARSPRTPRVANGVPPA